MMPDGTISSGARRLLDVLSSCCRRRDAAMPDRWLAGEIGCSVREVIDLADELLAAGHLVIAETTAPFGRWLVTSPEDLSAGDRYRASLRGRACATFVRARHVRAAIEATSIRLRTAPDQAAQGWLFPDPRPDFSIDTPGPDMLHRGLTDRRSPAPVGAAQESEP